MGVGVLRVGEGLRWRFNECFWMGGQMGIRVQLRGDLGVWGGFWGALGGLGVRGELWGALGVLEGFWGALGAWCEILGRPGEMGCLGGGGAGALGVLRGISGCPGVSPAPPPGEHSL